MTETDRFNRILDEGKCIGCGLCASLFPEKLGMTLAATGYLRPSSKAELSAAETDAIYDVCPGVVQTGLPQSLYHDATRVDDVWGPYRRLCTGFASDPTTRPPAVC